MTHRVPMEAPRDKRACRHIETACLRTTRRQFSSGGGARRAIKGWPRFLCTARGRLQVQSASTLAIARDDSALSDAVQCVQRSCARRALAAAVLVHDFLNVDSVRVYYMDRSSVRGNVQFASVIISQLPQLSNPSRRAFYSSIAMVHSHGVAARRWAVRKCRSRSAWPPRS